MATLLPALLTGRIVRRRGEPEIIAAPRARVVRTVVKKRGPLASLLAPIGVAIAALIVGIPAIFAVNIFTASEARRALHDSAVVGADTVVKAPVRRQVADGEVEFVVRQSDGALVRVIAGKDATDAFVRDTVASLEAARAAAHQRAGAALDQVFLHAFASREQDLDAYADWFFAWGQSWRLLYEATTGAVQEAFRLGFSRTQVSDASRHAVEDYLLRHYQDFVLKPGQRDPAVVDGVRQVFADANAEFLGVLGGLDDRVQRFVADHAVYTEPFDGDAVAVKVDWDAEKWRAPRHFGEDRTLEPVRTVAVAGTAAVILKPIVERVALPLLARTTAAVASSARTVASGAAVGSIEPGFGTAIGLVAGLAIDWGINAIQGGLQRGDFIAENAAALDATIAGWKAAILPEVDRAVDVWFDDAEAMVAGRAR
jgi:hypothetical protein